MYTGLCLSFCIRDIIKGKVKIKEVEVIINGTICRDDSSWEITLAEYAKTFWHDDAEKGIQIARDLIAAGKVIQPRLQGKPIPKIDCKGWWLNEQKRVVFFR